MLILLGPILLMVLKCSYDFPILQCLFPTKPSRLSCALFNLRIIILQLDYTSSKIIALYLNFLCLLTMF